MAWDLNWIFMTKKAINSPWVSQYILRKRYLFYAQPEEIKIQKKDSLPEDFSIELIESDKIFNNKAYSAWLPKSITPALLSELSVKTCFIYNRSAEKIIGAGSIIKNFQDFSWQDNTPLLKGEARLIGDFIDPQYRGFGLGKILNNYRAQQVIKCSSCNILTAIVESHRTPALRGQRTIFPNETSNWLFKVAGRNIFSFVQGGQHQGFWYVGPGRQRKLIIGGHRG